jgi:hypothetical protein
MPSLDERRIVIDTGHISVTAYLARRLLLQLLQS